MNLVVKEIKSPGDLEKERVVFSVVGDTDVGLYGIMASNVSPRDKKSAISGTKIAYWFEDKPVKTGDTVVLYTKKGSSNNKVNSDGSSSYFFYMKRTEPLWEPDANGVVLFQTKDWKFTPVKIIHDE